MHSVNLAASLNRFAALAVVIDVDRERDPLGLAMPVGAVRADPAGAWLAAVLPVRDGGSGHPAVRRNYATYAT